MMPETEFRPDKKKKRKKERMAPCPSSSETTKTSLLAAIGKEGLKDRPHVSVEPIEVQVFGDVMSKKKRNKKREQYLLSNEAVLHEMDMEREKKQRKKLHHSQPTPSPVTGEVEEQMMRKKKKTLTDGLPPKERAQRLETSEKGLDKTNPVEPPTVSLELGEMEKWVWMKKRREPLRHSQRTVSTPVIEGMEEQKMRKKKKGRKERLPVTDTTESPAMEIGEKNKKTKKKSRTRESIETEIGEKRTKTIKRRREKLEVEMEGEKRKTVEEDLLDSLEPVETKKGGRKKKKKHEGGKNIVMEVVVTEHKEMKKKKHEVTTADGRRTNERKKDEEFYFHREIQIQYVRPGKTVSSVKTRKRCIEELKEFVPDIESKTPREIQRHIRYDLERFKAFKSQGIPIRSGLRFTEEENKRLAKNVSDFLASTNIESAIHLFYPRRFEDPQRIIRLRSQHGFYSRISEGIPHTTKSVYSRGRILFDSYHYKGRFSAEEAHQLKELQALYGNQWMKISDVMHRSAACLANHNSMSGSQKGPWLAEEKDRLMDAMKEHLQVLTEPAEGQTEGEVIRKEKLYKNLPWRNISQKVQTRSWILCKMKWMTILKHKMAPGRKAVFSRDFKGIQAKIDLIKRLYALQMEDLADINWDDIAESIGSVTPRYVQQQFHYLKASKVPMWKQMTCSDVIDFLYENVLPVLEKSLTNLPQIEEDQDQETAEPKEFFLLSDIFSKYQEVNNVK